MLLITDRQYDETSRLVQDLKLVWPCTVISADRPTRDLAGYPLVICDIALNNPGSIGLVRTVLTNIRDLNAPVLCLLRENSRHMAMQARAVGATDILPYATPRSVLLSKIAGLIREGNTLDHDVSDDQWTARAGMLEGGLALGEIFDAVRHQQPISRRIIRQGASAVVTAIGNARIRSWLDVVMKHDDTTYQHCLLVAGLVAAFALDLGFSREDQKFVSEAALVHDVGKARVPIEILNKPGSLSAEEMAVMRTHVRVGHDLLVQQGGFDSRILDVVLHHHEYLDGSGYPDGLRGEQISDLSRLATICDIFAALIERRSYKPPMSPQDALAVLTGMTTKLDGDLVKAFGRVVRSM